MVFQVLQDGDLRLIIIIIRFHLFVIIKITVGAITLYRFGQITHFRIQILEQSGEKAYDRIGITADHALKLVCITGGTGAGICNTG